MSNSIEEQSNIHPSFLERLNRFRTNPDHIEFSRTIPYGLGHDLQRYLTPEQFEQFFSNRKPIPSSIKFDKYTHKRIS